MTTPSIALEGLMRDVLRPVFWSAVGILLLAGVVLDLTTRYEPRYPAPQTEVAGYCAHPGQPLPDDQTHESLTATSVGVQVFSCKGDLYKWSSTKLRFVSQGVCRFNTGDITSYYRTKRGHRCNAGHLIFQTKPALDGQWTWRTHLSGPWNTVRDDYLPQMYGHPETYPWYVWHIQTKICQDQYRFKQCRRWGL